MMWQEVDWDVQEQSVQMPRKRGEQQGPPSQNQGKASAPKVSLAYKLWVVKNYRPESLDPKPSHFPQSR